MSVLHIVEAHEFSRGDVVVLRGDFDAKTRDHLSHALMEQAGIVAVFVPPDCSVEVERPMVSQEDRGAGADKVGCFVGVPED